MIGWPVWAEDRAAVELLLFWHLDASSDEPPLLFDARGGQTPLRRDNMVATEKQVAYALALLGRAGWRTDWMDASFSPLASMRERHGRVADWLAGMDRAEISRLIDGLQSGRVRRR